MITRREALSWLLPRLGALGVAACRREPITPGPIVAPAPLKVDPIADLVSTTGLAWLLEARPTELMASASMGPAIATILPPERLDALARRQGLDVRRARQLAVAGYPGSTLALASLDVDPVRVEAAFVARAVAVEGRAVDARMTRFWGTAGGEREQVAVFGHEAVGIERGRLGPLRPAIYFAEGKLKRSLPALAAEPLAGAAARVGDAPLRLWVPGPFEGEWAQAVGGLLRVATAAAATVRPVRDAPATAIAVRIVITGAWGADATAAAERLGACFRVLANDPLGRLTGLDRPIADPLVTGDEAALGLDVLLDPRTIAAGLNAATGASLAEMMAF